MEQAPREIVGVLLAAGISSRFGGDKLCYRLSEGTPIAVAAAVSLRAACSDTIAVLRPRQDALAGLLSAAGYKIVFCADASEGMGHSLAAGVRAASDASGWVVALADMPFIATASHQAVVSRLRLGASLVATEYQGQRGHPVGFSRIWLDPLIAMTGDQGGKTILEQHQKHLVRCPVKDPGVLRDIDRPEDLKYLNSNTTSR